MYSFCAVSCAAKHPQACSQDSIIAQHKAGQACMTYQCRGEEGLPCPCPFAFPKPPTLRALPHNAACSWVSTYV